MKVRGESCRFFVILESRRKSGTCIKGDEVPQDLDGMRVLVALGGPMGVADVGSEKYPFLAKEVELLKRVHPARPGFSGNLPGRAAPGPCGGCEGSSQCEARGQAGRSPVPVPEFGWLPVTFPFPGGTEPMVMGMMDGAMMFHGIYDTFDLPKLPGSGQSAAPPRRPPRPGVCCSVRADLQEQAFRFKNRLFGFQYHLELTEQDMEQILSAGKEEVVKTLGPGGEPRFARTPASITRVMRRLGDRILQNFVQFLKVY